MRFYLLICGDHRKIIAMSPQSSMKEYHKVNHVKRELITVDHQVLMTQFSLIMKEKEREKTTIFMFKVLCMIRNLLM